MPQPSHPVFETACKRTLDECAAISAERGASYADSWALENTRAPFTEAFLGRCGIKLSREQLRLVVLSALADVKISRITSGGPHKRDNYVDCVNYVAALASLRDEYEARMTQSNVVPIGSVARNGKHNEGCGIPPKAELTVLRGATLSSESARGEV